MIAYSVDNFHFHRASGTVYTALDIATGQEVRVNIQSWFLFSFIRIDQISSLMVPTLEKKNEYHWVLEVFLLVSKISEVDSLLMINQRKGKWVFSTEKKFSKVKNLPQNMDVCF